MSSTSNDSLTPEITPTPADRARTRVVHELEGAAGGAAAGAVAGLMAGPVGAIVGAAIGAAAGAVAEAVVERDRDAEQDHDADLDEVIGVTSGEIGAPNLKHPPAKIGAF